MKSDRMKERAAMEEGRSVGRYRAEWTKLASAEGNIGAALLEANRYE
jgi:hypothetical protein